MLNKSLYVIASRESLLGYDSLVLKVVVTIHEIY